MEIPNENAWAISGHADAEAEAFTHWDEDDPSEVPASCAKCHSEPSQLNFLDADGTQAGIADNPAPTGTVSEDLDFINIHYYAAAATRFGALTLGGYQYDGKSYAANVNRAPVAYDGCAYPYFFHDNNGNGEVNEGEASYGNRYQSWTPRLLRAAYNYQYAQKDPGAFAHHGQYMIQVLYDSLEDIARQVPINMTDMVRP